MELEKLKNHFSKWCLFLIEIRDGKQTKRPINPYTGFGASTTKPETFSDYDTALAAYKTGAYAGMGALMASASNVIVIDLDGVIDESGAFSETALDALAALDGAYVEKSQSGRGLHFVLQGSRPEWVRCERLQVAGHSVEFYFSSSATRAIWLTGNQLRDGEVKECRAGLETLLRKFGFAHTAKAPGEAPLSVRANGIDTDTAIANCTDTDEGAHSDEALYKLLQQNNKRGKITRLLAGNIQDYNNDHSAADLALCGEISWYTKDAEQIARLFSRSQLAKREKWERDDYRQRTIKTALESATGDYFSGRKVSGAAKLPVAAEAVLARYGDKLSSVEGLATDRRGNLRPTIDNCLKLLARDHRTKGCLGYNEFSGLVETVVPLREVFGQAASNVAGEFLDSDITAVRAFLEREFSIRLTKNDACDVIEGFARDYEFNPVVEALDSARANWDGKNRLDDFLAVYFGADVSRSPEYHRAIGAAFMIGCVARAKEPGCKQDHMLCLEAGQGEGKSTAVKVLAESICPNAFSEGLPAIGGGSKEAVLALRGIWIVELPEMSAIKKSEAEHIKAFISTRVDRVRAPYGRRTQSWARRCCLISTTNRDEYADDDSGARRFWGVKVGRIDIEKLKADVLQIWGEAVARYEAGEPWHITDTAALRQAGTEQAARQVTGAADDEIAEVRDELLAQAGGRLTQWKIFDLYRKVFPSSGMDPGQFTMAESRQFASALRRNGFASRKNGTVRWFISPEAIRDWHEANGGTPTQIFGVGHG